MTPTERPDDEALELSVGRKRLMAEQERLEAHLDRLVAAVDAAEAATPEHRRLTSSKDGTDWCDECGDFWEDAHPALEGQR